MNLSLRQEEILTIVKENQPITGGHIAKRLGLSRATIRPDLTVLTMLEILTARPKVGYFYTGKNLSFNFVSRARNRQVKSYMSLPVNMNYEDSVYDGIVSIFLEDVGTLFVLKDQSLEGVVSRKDLLRFSMGETDLEKTPLSVIMTRVPNVETIGPEESILAAAKKISEKNIDSLPVVEEKEGKLRVLGRISKTSITQIFVEWGEEK